MSRATSDLQAVIAEITATLDRIEAHTMSRAGDPSHTGPYFRPLEDFAGDESHQSKLYWTDERIVDGENPLQMGSNNSGKSVGGSTVHFAMVSLRFRPEWFRARSTLGYGADWRSTGAKCGPITPRLKMR